MEYWTGSSAALRWHCWATTGGGGRLHERAHRCWSWHRVRRRRASLLRVLGNPFRRRLERSFDRQAAITDPGLIAYYTGFVAPFDEWPVQTRSSRPRRTHRPANRTATGRRHMYQRYLHEHGPSALAYSSYEPDHPRLEPRNSRNAHRSHAASGLPTRRRRRRLHHPAPHRHPAQRVGLRSDADRCDSRTTTSSWPTRSEAAGRLADAAQEAIGRAVEPGLSLSFALAGIAHGAIYRVGRANGCQRS